MATDDRESQLTLGQSRSQAWELALLRAQHCIRPSGGNMLSDMNWIMNEYSIILRDLYPMNMATVAVYPNALGDVVKKKIQDLKDIEAKRLLGQIEGGN